MNLKVSHGGVVGGREFDKEGFESGGSGMVVGW